MIQQHFARLTFKRLKYLISFNLCKRLTISRSSLRTYSAKYTNCGSATLPNIKFT